MANSKRSSGEVGLSSGTLIVRRRPNSWPTPVGQPGRNRVRRPTVGQQPGGVGVDAPRITPTRPSSWHSIARPHMRPQPRAVGRGLMRFLARAPDLALAMWAVFPMPRGNAGQSSTRINAGALAHGPLCRLVFLHPVLIRGSGGTGRFLCVFHAMHARTRTVFCDPNRLFLGPFGKKSQNVADSNR